MDDQELEKFLDQVKREGPRYMPVVSQLCELYLATTKEQQERIRDFFSDNNVFRSVFDRDWYRIAREKLRETKDSRWLKHLLVRWSIENAREDSRDTLQGLYHLWNEAKDTGIDPLPYFEQVARVSSKSTAKLFRGFGNKSYFDKKS